MVEWTVGETGKGAGQDWFSHTVFSRINTAANHTSKLGRTHTLYYDYDKEKKMSMQWCNT